MMPTIGRSFTHAAHDARLEDAGVLRRERRPSTPRVIATLVSALVIACTTAFSRSKTAGPPSGPVGGATLFASRADWVVQENQKPGTTAWKIKGAPSHIAGYADHVSAQVGDKVRLFVSTPADHFHVEAYRFGWYGGDGARLIWRSDPVNGHDQSSKRFVSSTRMVEATWKPSLNFPVTSRWVQGAYLLLLVASNGSKSYIPITIRDDSSHADLVIQLPTTTWQAYNRWGGYSLYVGPRGASDRSYVVSFDRPYLQTHGAPEFMDRARPLIALAERKGYDVTYWTDNDLHRRPGLLRHHRALITLGHDEYWSSEMRTGAMKARAAGVNLAFLGSNAVYRHIRLTGSPLGPTRREISYKDDWRKDPLYGIRDQDVTSDWRSGPVPRPESIVIGGFYQCYPVQADMVVSLPRSWLFRHTGAMKGQRLPDLIRLESDAVESSPPTPRTIMIFAHSPANCGGHADVSYYTTHSKAGVLDTGTNEWIGALRCGFPGGPGPSSPIAWCSHVVVKATANVLTLFSRGPAGTWHPSRSNLGRFGIHLRHPIDP